MNRNRQSALATLATLSLLLAGILLTPPASAADGSPTVMVADARPTLGMDRQAPLYANGGVENVHQYLASIARYPSGREASLHRPHGRVSVTFEIDGAGKVTEASVAQTSHSQLLDGVALATVRRGRYAAGPQDAARRFIVAFDYAPSRE